MAAAVLAIHCFATTICILRAFKAQSAFLVIRGLEQGHVPHYDLRKTCQGSQSSHAYTPERATREVLSGVLRISHQRLCPEVRQE